MDVQVLPYTELMAALDLPDVRRLEDMLITECMYTGIVKGKLDQNKACLLVREAVGRDVRPEDIPELLLELQNWCVGLCLWSQQNVFNYRPSRRSQQCNSVMAQIHEQVEFVQSAAEQARQREESLKKDVEAAKAAVKA